MIVIYITIYIYIIIIYMLDIIHYHIDISDQLGKFVFRLCLID